MIDISWITPWLATGSGVYTANDARDLKNEGVTHVVNCSDDENLFCEGIHLDRAGIFFCDNPMPDDGLAKPSKWFQRTVRAVQDVAKPGEQYRAFVHCSMGLNRGPSNAYAILRTRGYGPEEAKAAIVLARPRIAILGGLLYIPCVERALQAKGKSRLK